MNKQISIINKKIKAISTQEVALVLSDGFQIIQEIIFDQFGMKIKDKEGKEISSYDFFNKLSQQYEIQLNELLQGENVTNVKQLTIE